MNNLDFSPISEKDQQSIDVLSFLHTPRINQTQQKRKASSRVFDKLSRVLQNRKSFSLQLLKQFILFPEDEETIFVPYKYSRYELENGINCMQNTYGIRLKITVGKAFEDIRSYCIKKKAYENPVHVGKFIDICSKIMRIKEKEKVRDGIKILRNFIDQQNQQIQKQSNINQHKQKTTQLSFHKRSKQIYDMQSDLTQFTKLSERKENISKQFHRMLETERVGKYLNYKKEDFLKTAKALNRGNARQEKKMRINWNEESSYQQVSEEESKDNNPSGNNNKQKEQKYIFKSKSTREHYELPHFAKNSNPNNISSNPALQSSSREGFSRLGSQNICDDQIFKTHRRNSHKNITNHHHSYEQHENSGIQNVVIIRSSNTPKRVPDRYIRIPVLSEQIKIIQIKPDEQKNKEAKKENEKQRKFSQDCQMLTKRLQTISSNRKRSEKSSSRQSFYQNVDKNYSSNQKKYISSDSTHNIGGKNDHDCLGCKYCQFLKDVEAYRLKRAAKTPQYTIF